MKTLNEPCIGLYWLNEKQTDILHFFTEPVSSGEEYLNWTISTKDHYAYWEELLDEGKTKIENYEELPRGRVSFNRAENIYTIYHGNWLTQKLKEKLSKLFNLNKEKIYFEYDEHYDIINFSRN